MKTPGGPEGGMPIQCVPLGDTGIGIIRAQLMVCPMENGDIVIGIGVVGGKASALVPMDPQAVIVGELARFTAAELAGYFMPPAPAPDAKRTRCPHHTQFYGAGTPMPCADWRCPGSPLGRDLVVLTAPWPRTIKRYSRVRWDGAIVWRLDYHGPG